MCFIFFYRNVDDVEFVSAFKIQQNQPEYNNFTINRIFVAPQVFYENKHLDG